MSSPIWWRVLPILLGVLSVVVVKSFSTASHVSNQWPEGLYGLPKPIDGCPMTDTVTWETGMLFQDCEDTNPKTSRSPSFHLAGFVTSDVQQEFCIKTSTIDDSTNPPWPSGQYCIYQKGDTCPPGLESGWVVWDDESEMIGNNKNKHNGTLPRGIYNTNTKMYFCCSTKGNKLVAMDLPVFSPFYLIAFRSNLCQLVRGTTATREFIYYETEYYSIGTKNDYGGAYPYRATKNRYGHTIYYCYYIPNYCPPLSNSLMSSLHPHRCTQTKANVFDDTCTVRCNPGFVPRDLASTRSVCKVDGTWNLTTLADCIPAPTTATTLPQTNTSTTGFTSTSDNSIVTETSVITKQSTLNTHLGNTASIKTDSKGSVFTMGPSSLLATTEGENQVLVTQALTSDDGGLSSIGRIIAGSVCGGILALGVVVIICVSYCRKDRARKMNKTRQKLNALDKSKSLEELVAGRNIIMNRTSSSESFIYSDPINCEVQYTVVKTDNNPLYDSIDRRPQEPFDRTTDNVLYESVSPLLSTPPKRNGLNDPPPYHYKPTTL